MKKVRDGLLFGLKRLGLPVALILVLVMVGVPLLPTTTLASSGEDCLPYNANNLRIVDEGANGWLLTDGRSRMLMLANKADAQAALALAKRHTAHCFIGRDNTRSNRGDYIVEYWTGNSNIPTRIEDPDCISYNRNNLYTVDEGANGWLLTDGRSRMVMLASRADAQAALALAKEHTAQCFIGRDNTRPNRKDYIVDYWMGRPNLLNDMIGSWANENPNTGGITRVAIRSQSNNIYAHMWGACHPQDCDWGETSTRVSDVIDGMLNIVWNFSFKTETQQLIMMGNARLCVIGKATYNDNRADRSYAECYVKKTVSLTAPAQVTPPDGIVFPHYPRTTTLVWMPVNGAASYTVEIDCYHCCESGKWCTDVGKNWRIKSGLTTTSYTFDFVGAQPGRWRVWAVDANGQAGTKSNWWTFRYTR